MGGRRKTITRVTVFLLLGAIVNVAVACWCYLSGEFRTSWEYLDRNRLRQWVTSLQHHALEVEGVTWQGKPGARIMRCEGRPVGADAQDFDKVAIERCEIGWPWRAMFGQERTGSHTTLPPSQPGGMSTGFFTPRPPIVTWTAPEIPQFKPLWPGFAINTLFYAAILWGLFAAPFALRRRIRIRRGLCPACAYPVGESDVCTECGAKVKA